MTEFADSLIDWVDADGTERADIQIHTPVTTHTQTELTCYICPQLEVGSFLICYCHVRGIVRLLCGATLPVWLCGVSFHLFV